MCAPPNMLAPGPGATEGGREAPRASPVCARLLGAWFSCGYQLWQRHFVRFALDRVEGAFGKALTSPLQVALVPPARARTHNARVCNQVSTHLTHL